MNRLLVLLFALPICAQTEPNPVFRYLMNEPVTLFDMGMYQMILRLRNDTDRVSEIYRSASDSHPAEFILGAKYDADSGHINIAIVAFDTSADPLQMSDGCRASMETIGGKGSIRGVRRSLPGMFSHYGFVNDDAPDDFHELLEKSVKLQCIVLDLASQPRFKATMTMGSDDFLVE